VVYVFTVDAAASIKPKFHYADFPVTSALAHYVDFPETYPFRGSRHNGIWGKGDVTGLSWASRGSRRSGIWALLLLPVFVQPTYF